MLRKSETEFLLKFLAIFFALFLLLKTLEISPILNFVAWAEYCLLRAIGIPSSLSANTLTLKGVHVAIVPECSGLFMPVLLAALLWSTKLGNGRRIRFMLFFTPLLFAFNLIRLLITIVPFISAPQFFSAVHIFLWFVDSAIVLAIWMSAQGIRISDIFKMRKKAGMHGKL